jgi:hypothetical protein
MILFLQWNSLSQIALHENVVYEKSHEGTPVSTPVIEDVSDLLETAAAEDDTRNHFEISMHPFTPPRNIRSAWLIPFKQGCNSRQHMRKSLFSQSASNENGFPEGA